MIIETDFLDHPKTLRLGRALRTPLAPFFLMRLWAHCQLRRTDLILGDEEDIAAICRFEGKARPFVKALLDGRWLAEKTDGGFLVLGWREKNDLWLKKVEAGKARHSQSNGSGKRRSADSTAPAECDSADSTLPKCSQRNADVQDAKSDSAAREERRGDKNRGEPPPSPPAAGAGEGKSEEFKRDRDRLSRLLNTEPSRPWSYQAEHALSRISPIPDEEFAAVAWLHAQPATETRPKVRTGATSLCEFWTDEVSKARQYAAIAKVALPEAEISAKKKETGPVGWQDAHARLWPEAKIPEDWSSIPLDLRNAIQTHLEHP